MARDSPGDRTSRECEPGGDGSAIAAGFAFSLFLIGTALTRKALRSVGIRPLALGGLLWVFISAASLIAVKVG